MRSALRSFRELTCDMDLTVLFRRYFVHTRSDTMFVVLYALQVVL